MRTPPRRSPSRYLDQQAYAIEIDGERIQLECKRCAHRWWSSVPGVEFARKMLSYWGRANGGCTTFCPKCDPRDYRAAAARARRRNRR